MAEQSIAEPCVPVSSSDKAVPAESAFALSAPQATRETWFFDEFVGPKEQLIAAGLAKDGMFPGDSGMPANSVSFRADGTRSTRSTKPNGRNPLRISIKRRANSRFRVWVFHDKEEMARREREEELTKARKVAALETAEATKELAAMSMTEKKYAKGCADLFWAAWTAFCNAYCCEKFGTEGYLFHEDDIDKFQSMAAGLYRKIKYATLISDRPRRLNRLKAARAAEARLDGPLQQFLQRVPTLPALDEPSTDGKSCGRASRWVRPTKAESRRRRFAIR